MPWSTRLRERNGDNLPNLIPRYDPRTSMGTHFFGKEDSAQLIVHPAESGDGPRMGERGKLTVFTAANWGPCFGSSSCRRRFSSGENCPRTHHLARAFAVATRTVCLT